MARGDEASSSLLRGRCLCGAVRYEVQGPPGPAVLCHCRMCRRASGSAFAANASVRADRLRWLAGVELVREFASSPAQRRGFCGRCGAPLYARIVGRDDVLRIRLGSLEDDPGIRPVAHVHVASRAPWLPLPDDGLPTADEDGDPDWTRP
jgi:hypothetical protein